MATKTKDIVTKYLLPSKVYLVLKWCSLIALDAIGTAYNALSVIWGLPYGDEVLQSAVVISILIAALIGVSQATSTKE